MIKFIAIDFLLLKNCGRIKNSSNYIPKGVFNILSNSVFTYKSKDGKQSQLVKLKNRMQKEC